MKTKDSHKDVFISHAFEDKEAYVLPLTKAFDNFAISYWLDTVEIGWGESIVEKMNEGLAGSRFVLVLLTESFLQKGWTKRELDAAFAAEVAYGKTILLPVLAAPQERIFGSYPLLRPKKYLRVDLGVEQIAVEVSRLLDRAFKTNWICNHPARYIGEVWIRILKQESALNQTHRISIRWGPWRHDFELAPDPTHSVVLVHTKGDDGFSIPLFLTIEPPCFVTFGSGKPPAGTSIDINSGWFREEAIEC